jgi:hypothetical protein
MKRWKVYLLVGWLAFVAGMMAGCNVYLPPDMQTALDLRIIELQRAQQLYPAPECANVIDKDLEFLTTLKESVK